MYTYDQALEACKEHRHLVGSQLRRGWRNIGTIEGVVVAPLDGINQYKFLKDRALQGAERKANPLGGLAFFV